MADDGDVGMDDELLHYALKGAHQHESMTGNTRTKDAFFDGIINKTLKVQTKASLLKAYGAAFVCQDGNCKVCSWYRDGEPVKCRSCHGQVRPKEPSQQEVCQFHKSHDCLQLPGFDVHGKAADTFVSVEEYERVKSNLPKYRSVSDYIVGYHKPRTPYDEDWGVKKCGCIVHVFNWETCSYCSPAHYKTTNYSVQWRHYVDVERVKKPADQPLVYNSDYYNRIFEILTEENKDASRYVEVQVDYADCSSDIFLSACSFCERLPMPGDESYKRCGQCKVARYCSADCQKAAWPTHRKECVVDKSVAAAQAAPAVAGASK